MVIIGKLKFVALASISDEAFEAEYGLRKVFSIFCKAAVLDDP